MIETIVPSRPLAVLAMRGAVLIAIALLLIFVALPAVLGAA